MAERLSPPAGGDPPGGRTAGRIAALGWVLLWAAGLWAAGGVAPGAQGAGWLWRAPVRTCQVSRVLDGDSMRLACDGETVEVRLRCIDAPEGKQVPWGKQSRRHLREIAPKEVELEGRETDRFGRVVGDVYTPGPERRLLNLAQVEAGQAAVYTRFCTDPRFPRAQDRARAAGLGIWSRPGEQQTPWTFRHRQSRGGS